MEIFPPRRRWDGKHRRGRDGGRIFIAPCTPVAVLVIHSARSQWGEAAGRITLVGRFFRGDFFTVANGRTGWCAVAVHPPSAGQACSLSLGFYSKGRDGWGGAGARRALFFPFSFCKGGERWVVAPTELPSDPGADEPCTVPLRSVSCRLVLGSGSEPSDRDGPCSWGVRGAGCTYKLG